MYTHRQRYDFAHRALPQILFSQPAEFFMVLAGPQAAEFLADVWNLVNEKIAEAGETCDPAPFALQATTARIGDFPAVLVELPPPVETTECHYVCAVLLHDLNRPERPDPKTLALRYFTLEHNADAPQTTMLCGWQIDAADGQRHLNFGDGPAPGDLRKFAEAVKDLLRRTDCA